MKKFYGKNKVQIGEFCIAFILTTLVFLIFAGQFLFSNVVTFANNGDQSKLCFASFMKIVNLVKTGDLLNIVGIDIGSFNGATEFFLRPNLSNAYLPIYIFAAVGAYIKPRMAYMLFYFIHMLLSLYFTQRVGRKYLSFSPKFNFFLAACEVRIFCMEQWYTSFFIIVSLISILLYFSLQTIYTNKKKDVLACVMMYILAFTSGYITLSLFFSIFCFVFVIGYVYAKNGIKKWKEIVKFTIAVAIAGMCCLPYYVQVLDYVKNIVQNRSTLYDTTYYTLSIKDFIYILSSELVPSSNPIEQLSIISLDFLALLVIVVGFKQKIWSKLEKYEKYVCFVGIGTYILIFMMALEAFTPVALWVYSIVPILGGMHLPLRYMMITLITTYMAIIIIYRKIDGCDHKKIKYIGIVAFFFAVVISILEKSGVTIKGAYSDKFIFEMLLVSVLAYIICNYGIKSGKTILFGGIMILIPIISFMYQSNQVTASKAEITNQSIIYDENAIRIIDEYIAKLDEKPLYKYVAYDSVEPVPTYLLNNYAWYGYSNYQLSNYYGYEPHLCTPKDYLDKNPWFSNIDWQYILNTRADFIMTDEATIEADKELFDTIIDYDLPITSIGNGRIICKLKKFVPSIFSKREYIEDVSTSFDNGYFYARNLGEDNIIDFKTDNTTYYDIVIDAESDLSLAFLPYTNRHYHYYIDNEEVMPTIDEMQAILDIKEGKHEIKVVYVNKMAKIAMFLVLIPVIILFSSILGIEIYNGIKSIKCNIEEGKV